MAKPRAIVRPLVILSALVFAGTIARGQNQNQFYERYDQARRDGRYEEAERLARQGLRLAERDNDELWAASWQNNLANVCEDQQRLDEAEELFLRALRVWERRGGPEVDLIIVSNNLGNHYHGRTRYADAKPHYARVVEIREGGSEEVRGDAEAMAESLNSLGHIEWHLGNYQRAAEIHRRALAIVEVAHGRRHAAVATCLDNLGKALANLPGRDAETEKVYQRALEIRERVYGPDHQETAIGLSSLGKFYLTAGQFALAKPALERALAINERVYGSPHKTVADGLHDVALVYSDQGQLLEAEALNKRALAIREQLVDPLGMDIHASLCNLAGIYKSQGRFAEAERLLIRSIALTERTPGPEARHLAEDLGALGDIYWSQGRRDDAEDLFRRCQSIYEKLPTGHQADLARLLLDFAEMAIEDEDYGEAEALFAESLEVMEESVRLSPGLMARYHQGMAAIHVGEGNYAEAEAEFEKALDILEQQIGPWHPTTALCLARIAELELMRARYREAESFSDRAIGILERAGAEPAARCRAFELRAKAAWNLERPFEALADLRRAMDLADQQRGQAAGAEHERATYFTQFSDVFETMVRWQNELGNLSEAFAAIERSRARSLLDELSLAGTDFQIGLSSVERERLRQEGAELRSTVASIEQQLRRIVEAGEGDSSSRRAELEAELARARAALYEHHRNERSTSPIYRNLLSAESGPPRLSQIQRELVGADDLMLLYLFGSEAGYVLCVQAETVELHEIHVEEDDAEVLGIDAGPMTREQLRKALLLDGDQGVAKQLSTKIYDAGFVGKSAVLWQLLVPAHLREPIRDGSIGQLCVVPDGPLTLLPFETLVVASGGEPRYLVDVGPPVVYAPSATVLLNLARRPGGDSAAAGGPVLTVGNPAYRSTSPTQLASRGGSVLETLTVGSRYSATGGELAPLPFSDLETVWVAETFGNQGLASSRLTESRATESNVRAEVFGRSIVHLACHGFTDRQFGNYFGALALTPGSGGTDPADDGFLTLAEIYELNLRGCDLAILSACQTNYGPQQQGEGVWSLSRGFLVAGSRRVIASNWLVDDEAAASLVSYFCSIVARAKGAGEPVDYAAALRDAKRWVRGQKKWESPYYWGTFVLLGPN